MRHPGPRILSNIRASPLVGGDPLKVNRGAHGAIRYTPSGADGNFELLKDYSQRFEPRRQWAPRPGVSSGRDSLISALQSSSVRSSEYFSSPRVSWTFAARRRLFGLLTETTASGRRDHTRKPQVKPKVRT